MYFIRQTDNLDANEKTGEYYQFSPLTFKFFYFFFTLQNKICNCTVCTMVRWYNSPASPHERVPANFTGSTMPRDYLYLTLPHPAFIASNIYIRVVRRDRPPSSPLAFTTVPQCMYICMYNKKYIYIYTI